jgi:hypothetical protein
MTIRMKQASVREFIVFLLLVAVPLFALAQKHTGGGSAPPSAPPHVSAPSHAAVPRRSVPNRANTMSHTNTMKRTNIGRSNTMSRPSTSTRPNTMAGRGTSTMGHRNSSATYNAASRGTGTMNRGNSNAAHGNTMAGRTTNTMHAGAIRTPPGRTVSLRGGGSASIRPNGQIRSINRDGMQIHNNLRGGRTVVGMHNGARVVTTGRRGGYVQRAYITRGGHSYYSRTYYYHNEYHVAVYRSYYYGGYNYYGYYHPYWYHPAFYGWAYNPWPAPVYWGWGWGGAPWYGYYGPYFAPYPVYPSAAFWLTDYLISANLQAAYAAQAEAAAEAGGAAQNAAPADNQVASNGMPPVAPGEQVALSPEVKEAIAEEIKSQIAAAKSESGQDGNSSGGGQSTAASREEVPPALDPAHRTFVVSSDLDVLADGEECSLTQGDVLTRLTDTPDGDQKVNVSVASSKKGDCAAGKTVAVAVDDLQEMHNHFQEQIEEGMKALAAKQGTGGLPKSPDTGTTASNVPPPAPDKSAAQAISDQQKAADQTESQVKQEAGSSGDGSE